MDSTENKFIKPCLDEEDEACVRALVFNNSCMIPMVLNTAIELDLFEIIAKAGPGAHIPATQIASQLKTPNPSVASRLDRMLRLFVSHSLLTCSTRTSEDGSVERLYGLAPAGRYFLRNGEHGSLAALSAFASHRAHMEVGEHMKDAVLEGGNQFQKVHKKSFYEYMDIDPTYSKAFNEAMAGLSTIVMKKVLEIYKGFEGLSSLVDVGGGNGRALSMIISKYPSIRGINFDLPHVIKTAPSYPGIEHVEGNMFESVPIGDAIMVKESCHNWSDELCIELLKNCYKVLPNNGKVIIISALLEDSPETSWPSKYVSELDNTMLAYSGGKERTRKEFEALCKASGFSKLSVACCAFGVWGVIEFFK